MTTLITTANWIGLPSIAEWFSKLNANMKRERLARQTIKELSALSDKELNDIGIARGEIWSIAHDLEELQNPKAQANSNLRGWV